MCSSLLLFIFYCQCCFGGFVYIGNIYRFCPGQSGFMRLQQQYTLFCVKASSGFQHHWKMDSSLCSIAVNKVASAVTASLLACVCVVSQDVQLHLDCILNIKYSYHSLYFNSRGNVRHHCICSNLSFVTAAARKLPYAAPSAIVCQCISCISVFVKVLKVVIRSSYYRKCPHCGTNKGLSYHSYYRFKLV